MATVKEIQTVLKKKGFYTGAIDGISGPYTKAAIRAFQKSKGLLQDGIVGPITLKALGLTTVTKTSTTTRTVGTIQKQIESGSGHTFNNFTQFYNIVKEHCEYAYYFNGQYNSANAINMLIRDIKGAVSGLNCVDYTQLGVKLAKEMGYQAVPYGIYCPADRINHAIFQIYGKEFTSWTWIDLAAAASGSKALGLHWCSGATTKRPSWIPEE